MDVDDIYEIRDASDETIGILAGLIAASQIEEQLVYRECELDELWRLLKARRTLAGAGAVSAIDHAIEVVTEVHDMVSASAPEADVRGAAVRLRALAGRIPE